MQEMKYCSLLNMVNRNTQSMWQKVDRQLPPNEHLHTNQELQTEVKSLAPSRTFDENDSLLEELN